MRKLNNFVIQIFMLGIVALLLTQCDSSEDINDRAIGTYSGSLKIIDTSTNQVLFENNGLVKISSSSGGSVELDSPIFKEKGINPIEFSLEWRGGTSKTGVITSGSFDNFNLNTNTSPNRLDLVKKGAFYILFNGTKE